MKRWIAALVFLVLPAFTQQRQNFIINIGTPEGQALQSIGQESDDAKKLALMQEFLEKYPQHEGAGWVAAQLEAAYTKDKQYDKALEAAGKVGADGPNELDVAFNAVKAADAKGDAEQVKKWGTRTIEAARKITGTGKPPADDDEKHAIEYARDVGNYAEFAFYSTILKTKDPKQTIDLAEALEKVNPKSQYLWLATPSYVRATGAKACATASRLAAADSRNAEASLVAADCSWRAGKADGVVSNASRAVEALNSRPKVEGGSEGVKMGSANFYLGTGYAMQQKWGPANKSLRAALPSLKGEPITYANALFSLGLANYTLGKALGDKTQMREGLKFFEQSAEIASNVQDQAARNARLIRTELGGR